NSRMCPSSLYWTDDIIKTVEEYQNLPLHVRNDWIKQKKEEGMAKMREVNQRRLDYDRGMRELVQQNSVKKTERALLIKSRIQAMKDEKNSNNCSKYDDSILQECPTYQNHMYMQIRQSPQPLTERSWILLKKKLLKEYEERRIAKRQERQNKERIWHRSTVIQMRQYDIYQLSKNWLPDSSLEDSTDSNMNVDDQVSSTTTISDISSTTTTSDNSITLISNSDSTQNIFDPTKKSEMNTTIDATIMDMDFVNSNSDADIVPINDTNNDTNNITNNDTNN
ncbi:1550_t:CDS:2, partial [Gigaspora rosea]